ALTCRRDVGPTPEPCLTCPACTEIAQGTDLDVREIDGASYNGVDEVRKLQDSIPYRPSRDRFKIFVVDEVHMLSQSAWNAFLKTLEEPPPHVKFIFATTEVHKVPITILSRVQRFDFRMIGAKVVAERLRYVLEQEKIEADDAAISILSREAAGSMRDAMSLLDQVIAWGGDTLRGEDVARVLGVASHKVLYELSRALLQGDPALCLGIVADLANQGHDMTHVARDVLQLLRDLVVAKVCENPGSLLDLPDEEAREVKALAVPADTDDLLRLHQGFGEGFDDIARSGQPRAALEMLLVRLSRRPPLLPVDGMLQRLTQLEHRLHGGGAGPDRRRAAAPAAPNAVRPGSAPGVPASSTPANRPREPRSASGPRVEGGDDRKEPPRELPRPAILGPEVAADSHAAGFDAAPIASIGYPARVSPGAGEHAGKTASLPPSGPALRADATSPQAPRAVPSTLPPSSLSIATSGVATTASPSGSAVNGSHANGSAASSAPTLPRKTDARRDAAPLPEFQAPAWTRQEPTRSATRGDSGRSAGRNGHASAPAPNAEPPSLASVPSTPEALDDFLRKLVGRIASERPEIAAKLEHSVLLECQRDRVLFGWAKDSLFGNLVATTENREVIERFASGLLGGKVRVEHEIDSPRAAGKKTLSVLEVEARERRVREAYEQARSHPRIAEAIEVLGARLKELKLARIP
ncbi:MAG TPA: DNA polymerase III subunit gamma/tau, partial [Polyangiaceae bacterium]|nr:DNA polymerase III subunit gamma/tau [Polyangiaceae bacterium]